MPILRLKLLIIFLLTSVIVNANTIQKAGDIIQFTNPIIGLWMAANDNRDNEFLINYLACMGVVGLGKVAGKRWHYPASARPDHTAYSGMPSGHTASAWYSASFHRNPYLYAAAGITAISRIHARKHYWYQVLASIVISEGIVALNSRFNISAFILNDGVGLSMIWKL